MAIPAPKILLPSNGLDYTTDVPVQTLSGTTVANTAAIKVNGSLFGVSYTPGETNWAWTGTLSEGVNRYEIVAVEKGTESISTATVINITLTLSSNFITVSAPTGVSLKRYQDRIRISVAKSSEPNVIGYNFYVSHQSGGVNNEYVKINSALVDTISHYQDMETPISKTVEMAGQLRITTITEEVIRVYYYSADFTRDIYTTMVQQGMLPDIGFKQGINFYFVVTAVIYDPVLGKVTESTYSPELEGSPINIVTGIVDLPARTQNDIINTFSTELTMSDPGIDMKPGTVLRDIMDPISEEEARTYIIQDFLARSLSVSALQDFDDPNGDGISDPPDECPAKKSLQLALYLTSADQVQRIIDDQFDKLASNVNIKRMEATAATGSVVFYTKSEPIRDMQVLEGGQVSSLGDVDKGIPSQVYQILETKTLTYEDRESFWNPRTQRYELEVKVQALNAGSSGNANSNTITTINSGADSGFLVTNPNPIQFGTDLESNHDLASRIQLALFADTGTEGGYAKTAVSVPGVHGVRVEKAGDTYMFRDYDPIRQEHIGGKVDIYVQGSRIKQVEEKIAFSFSSGIGDLTGEQFSIVSAVSFQFKTLNPLVSSHTPIFEVNRVYNATRGKAYDISGYQIIGDGNIIDLNETLLINASIGLSTSDVILVDYKYRSSDTFILRHQPVISIVSVEGQLSGSLTPDNWELVKLQDPLEEGGSTIAHDSIRIKFANNLPLTEFQTITDEPHIVVFGVDEPLNYVGVDVSSIVITNEDKSVTYVRDADYTIIVGSKTEPTFIRILETGSINSNDTILISYVAIENFTIKYTTNALLSDVQVQVDKMKHACADVIVKQAIENAIDYNIVVTPKPGVTNTDQLASKIMTAIANFVSQVGVGVGVTQSDIVNVVKKVPDVDIVGIPFTRLVKADGSFITRDNIGTPVFELYNQGVVASYITATPVLSYKTIDKGGPENLFRGIFENNIPLMLQSDPLDVSKGPGRGYILGNGKIIVSTRDGALPDTKKYQVSYFVYGEKGSKDIKVAPLEYLRIGTPIVRFDTPRPISRQTF